MKSQIGFAIVFASVGLLLGGCQTQTPPPATGSAEQAINQPPAQPTSAKAQRRDVTGYRLLSGKLYLPANASAIVFANGAAPIQSVAAKQGDHVSKGETIVTLGNGQQDNTEQAKTTYEQALAAYNQAMAQYEQPVRDMQRQLAQAQDTERTIRETLPSGGVATNLQQATSKRQGLEDQLKIVESQAKTNEVPYKTQLDQAKLAVSEARTSEKQSSLTAPISGTVISLTATAGQTVSGHTAIATIVDLPELAIKSDVPPAQASLVKPGAAAAIMFGDYPDRKFVGRVRKLDTLPSNETGKSRYVATIDFTNTAGMIKPTSTVHSVGLVIGRHENALTVPVDAVSKDTKGKPTVRVLENGSSHLTPVMLGLSDGNFVEITSGLSEGDTVQVVPHQGDWILSLTATS